MGEFGDQTRKNNRGYAGRVEAGVIPYASTMIVLAILVLTYNLFYLVPWDFTIRDIGESLMLFSLVWVFARSKQHSVLRTPLSWVVAAYLLMVGLQIVLASFSIGQSISDGIIAARVQYYYLAFFLLVLLLDDERKLTQLFDYLSILAIIVFILALINYLGPNIIYNYKGQDWGVFRSGIKRIYIPGFSLIPFAFIWQMSKWTGGSRSAWSPRVLTLLFMGVIFFNQARGAILGSVFAMGCILLVRRKYAALIGITVAGTLLAALMAAFMHSTILLNPFVSSIEEVQQGSGTWGARLAQISLSLDEFYEHPWLGSGLGAVRLSTTEGDVTSKRELANLSYKSDLGYTVLLKTYGVAGVVWLLFFYAILLSLSRTSLNGFSKTGHPLLLFAPVYIFYVMLTMVTLNHLMYPDLIMLLFLAVTILLRYRAGGLIPVEIRPVNIPARASRTSRILRPKRLC